MCVLFLSLNLPEHVPFFFFFFTSLLFTSIDDSRPVVSSVYVVEYYYNWISLAPCILRARKKRDVRSLEASCLSPTSF